MRFQKGHKPTNKIHRGGRPTREQARLKQLAADRVMERFEQGLGSILDAYLSLATGRQVGSQRRKLDPATVRHAIERVLSQAPRKLVLDAQETVESFFDQLEKATGKKDED